MSASRKRHPCEVTADRLGDHLDRFYAKTDGRLRDEIASVRSWLEDRAEERTDGE